MVGMFLSGLDQKTQLKDRINKIQSYIQTNMKTTQKAP